MIIQSLGMIPGGYTPFTPGFCWQAWHSHE